MPWHVGVAELPLVGKCVTSCYKQAKLARARVNQTASTSDIDESKQQCVLQDLCPCGLQAEFQCTWKIPSDVLIESALESCFSFARRISSTRLPQIDSTAVRVCSACCYHCANLTISRLCRPRSTREPSAQDRSITLAAAGLKAGTY